MTLVTSTQAATDGGKRNFQSVVAFARASTTDVLAARDVVSDDEAAAKALVFDGMGSSGTIDRVRLASKDAVTSAFSLLLFSGEPTNHADNAPLALVDADLAMLLGRYDFADASKLDVGDWFVYRATNDYDAKQPTPYATADGRRLFGLLITTDGYTPASGALFNIRLQGTHDAL